ncbi:hypothetical protein Tco_1192164 [Tanacetum coccineum]
MDFVELSQSWSFAFHDVFHYFFLKEMESMIFGTIGGWMSSVLPVISRRHSMGNIFRIHLEYEELELIWRELVKKEVEQTELEAVLVRLILEFDIDKHCQCVAGQVEDILCHVQRIACFERVKQTVLSLKVGPPGDFGYNDGILVTRGWVLQETEHIYGYHPSELRDLVFPTVFQD